MLLPAPGSDPRSPEKTKPLGADIHDPKAQTSTAPGGLKKDQGCANWAHCLDVSVRAIRITTRLIESRDLNLS